MVAAENQAGTIASVPDSTDECKGADKQVQKGRKDPFALLCKRLKRCQTRRHAQELFPGYPAALLKP